MTRSNWYAQNSGGGWRTARTDHRCSHVNQFGLRCMAEIAAGTKYFDTNQQNPNSKSKWGTIKLCHGCASQEIAL